MNNIILQGLMLLLGLWFTYIGVKTLVSKKYYMTNVESAGNKSIDEAYKALPSWRKWWTRYGFGLQWLVSGCGLLFLFVYGLFR